MSISTEVQELIKAMNAQHEKDSKAMQSLLSQLISTRSEETTRTKSDEPEFIIESLATNISEFVFDPENNLTFETWYARYEDLFTIDAVKLDDAAKVRLLLRKLSTHVHSKYINYILPKHPRDYQFEKTVKKLTELSGLRKSQFHIRYNCFQIAKDDQTDFITFAGIVNKQCENFKLADLKLDQFKCLIFVMGMKSSTDFEIRTKLLNKLDDPKNGITLDGLVTECQRLINLKSDTALIQKQTATQINQLQSQSNGKTAIPRTPCWFCGNMHFVENCEFKHHKCKQCQGTGHKEGYCNAAKLSKRTKQNKPFSNARKNRKPAGKVNGIFSINRRRL